MTYLPCTVTDPCLYMHQEIGFRWSEARTYLGSLTVLPIAETDDLVQLQMTTKGSKVDKYAIVETRLDEQSWGSPGGGVLGPPRVREVPHEWPTLPPTVDRHVPPGTPWLPPPPTWCRTCNPVEPPTPPLPPEPPAPVPGPEALALTATTIMALVVMRFRRTS